MSEIISESHTSHILRNIIVGVVTAVLGAFIVYKIQNPVKDDFKKRKEATINAWNSYVDNRYIFSTTLIHMGDDSSENKTMDKLKQNVKHEIEVTLSNLENIKKTQDVDQKIISVVEVFSGQIKEIQPMFSDFYTKIENYAKENTDTAAIAKYGEELANKFGDDVGVILDRDVLRMETIRKDLCNQYRYEFKSEKE